MILPLLLTVDFMNFTYTKLPCSANVPPPAIVRKGSYSYYDKQMGSGSTSSLRVASVSACKVYRSVTEAYAGLPFRSMRSAPGRSRRRAAAVA